jgi:hypothetical protein
MAMSPLWMYAKNEHETFIEVMIRGGEHASDRVPDADLYRGARYVFPRRTLRDIRVNDDGTHIAVEFATRRFNIFGKSLHDIPGQLREPYSIQVSHGGSSESESRITGLEAELSRLCLCAEAAPTTPSTPPEYIEVGQSQKQPNGQYAYVKRQFSFADLQSINVNFRGTTMVLEFTGCNVAAHGVRLSNVGRRILNGKSISLTHGMLMWPRARSNSFVDELYIDEGAADWRFDEEGDLVC